MTGNKYSAVRRSIAQLLASKEGRAVFALNKYNSGTPIVPALDDKTLGDFYRRVDQAASPGQSAVAAAVINGQLHLAKIVPAGNVGNNRVAEKSDPLIADAKTTLGMFFAELARSKKLAVKTEPFDYGKESKVAVSFKMPGHDDSLQPT